MPQKKVKKKENNGASMQLQKVGGYAYTKKFNELQTLVRALQAQAEAAKQQVEESRQREMVGRHGLLYALAVNSSSPTTA
jgi:hypothetical protein